MLVGLCEVELNLYDTNSLKEKRRIIKSLIARIQSRFNVSIAEIAYLDTWNRSKIGFAYVANEHSPIEKEISKVLNFIENDHRVEIINTKTELL